jgi:hypothetical protein
MFKEFNTTKDLDLGAGLKNITPAQKEALNQWRTKLLQDYSQTKLLSMRAGMSQADMALLNYNMRTNFNSFIAIGFPFIFWTMRSSRNWAQTVIERPALMSTYIRLLNLMSSYSEEDTQFPSRHRGKLRIPMYGLPDWTDNAVYYDPFGDLIPLNQFIRPFERVGAISSRLANDAFGSLREDFKSGKITSKQFLDAVGEDPEKRGVPGNPLWEAALAKASTDNSGEWQDFMELFASPNIFFSAAYNKYQNMKNGTTNPVLDQLPVSRTWQGLWGMWGMDPSELGGWLGKQQKSISEVTEWGLYYVKRALSNMAAQDPSITQAAITAMIEQRGPLWEQAEAQVRFEQGLQGGYAPVYALKNIGETGWRGLAGSMLLGLFPGGLVPAGELRQRYLSDKYNAAWQRYNDGTDPAALDKFFDAYPEYDARRLLFEEDPNALLNRFLAMGQQEIYWNATDLERRIMREQMGEEWYIGVINSSTRDPTAFAPEKMAEFSNKLGQYVPQPPGGLAYTQQEQLGLPKQTTSQTYELLKAEQLTVAPDYYALNDMYFSLPMGEREKFLLSYPAFEQAMEARRAAIQKYVISEIPNFYELQSAYYAIGSGALEKLKAENPQLVEGWAYSAELKAELLDPMGDWQSILDGYMSLPAKSAERRAYKAQHPEVDAIFDALDEVDKRIAERFPQYEYLNDLYQELGADTRREYLESHPDLQKGWGLLDEYEKEWLKIDPLYEEHNDAYYDLPPSPRSMMLDAYPELQEAWGVQDTYIQEHPDLKQWIDNEEQQKQYMATQEVMEAIPDLAYPGVIKYFALGEPLTQGVREALEWEWEKRGKPFADFWEWMKSMRYYFQY